MPILHVNGYKIASPTQAATMSDEELSALYRGYGWAPRIIDVREAYGDEGEDPDGVLGAALDDAYRVIRGAVKERGTR